MKLHLGLGAMLGSSYPQGCASAMTDLGHQLRQTLAVQPPHVHHCCVFRGIERVSSTSQAVSGVICSEDGLVWERWREVQAIKRREVYCGNSLSKPIEAAAITVAALGNRHANRMSRDAVDFLDLAMGVAGVAGTYQLFERLFTLYDQLRRSLPLASEEPSDAT